MTKLLLIDDDMVDREAAIRDLTKHHTNIEITEVSTGKDAIDRIANEKFDCIVLDYQLTDCDGIQFLDMLEHSSREVCTPVVMLTGKGRESIAVKAMKRGVYDYLVKSQYDFRTQQIVIRSPLTRS